MTHSIFINPHTLTEQIRDTFITVTPAPTKAPIFFVVLPNTTISTTSMAASLPNFNSTNSSEPDSNSSNSKETQETQETQETV